MPVDSDLSRVPAALATLPQWLVWRFEQFKGEAKPRKVPYYASGVKRTGTQGSEKDRARLVEFAPARALVEAGKFDGVGFAFLPGDGLIGIDLDGVRDAETGELQPRAAEIITACASFTEVSPSGKGVHIYCLGETKSNKDNNIGVEVFCGTQFFTVTGRQVAGTPGVVTAIAAPVLERLHALVNAAKDKARAAKRKSKPEAKDKARAAKRKSKPEAKDKARAAKRKSKPEAARKPVDVAIPAASSDSYFAQVNEAAQKNPHAWVPTLLPKAQPFKGGYRITSHALGRDLEEDLQIDPDLIWDFGEECHKSPIDLVMQWGGSSSALDAADRLCSWLGVDPARLGKSAPRIRSKPSGSGASGVGEDPPKWLDDGPPPDALMDSVRASADWIAEFRTSTEGKIFPTLFNTVHLLENDPEWSSGVAFDLFSYRVVDRRATPPREWSDVDDVKLALYISRCYRFEPKKQTLMDAVMAVSHGNEFHPVREWLDGLKWDGKRRLHRLFQRYFGAGHTLPRASLGDDPDVSGWKPEQVREWKYLALVGIKWLVGAVARIKSPGCKLDTMIVLEGGQGARKSTALRELFGPEWFADAKLNIGDKDSLAQMQGKWCYEMAEMDAHRKADDTAFKQFLSSPVDRVRWHYGRRAEDVPRQCIFAGTTNQDYYAKDETGNRRMWPVEVSLIDVVAIRRDRAQLFAEAAALWRERTSWWIDRDTVALDQEDHAGFERPLSEWDLVDEQSEERQMVDAWEYPIAEWLADHNKLDKVTTAQLMGDALKLDTSRWTPPEQKRVAAIMRRRGWRQSKVGPKHARVAGWVRLDQEAEVPPSAVQEADDVPV